MKQTLKHIVAFHLRDVDIFYKILFSAEAHTINFIFYFRNLIMIQFRHEQNRREVFL